jgi:hypothetical protein
MALERFRGGGTTSGAMQSTITVLPTARPLEEYNFGDVTDRNLRECHVSVHLCGTRQPLMAGPASGASEIE